MILKSVVNVIGRRPQTMFKVGVRNEKEQEAINSRDFSRYECTSYMYNARTLMKISAYSLLKYYKTPSNTLE